MKSKPESGARRVRTVVHERRSRISLEHTPYVLEKWSTPLNRWEKLPVPMIQGRQAAYNELRKVKEASSDQERFRVMPKAMSDVYNAGINDALTWVQTK